MYGQYLSKDDKQIMRPLFSQLEADSVKDVRTLCCIMLGSHNFSTARLMPLKMVQSLETKWSLFGGRSRASMPVSCKISTKSNYGHVEINVPMDLLQQEHRNKKS